MNIPIDYGRIGYLIQCLRKNECYPHEHLRNECADYLDALSYNLQRERFVLNIVVALIIAFPMLFTILAFYISWSQI